jgi:ArsR family transcriptional regulator
MKNRSYNGGDLMDQKELLLPEGESLSSLADFYRVFADETRIRILCELLDGEKRVLDIARDLGMSHSAVSHQLQLLRARRLVSFRRDGKSVRYSIADEHIHSILLQGIEHVGE